MSKTRLIFATGNQGKVNEFKQMLGDEYEILSMKDIGVDIDTRKMAPVLRKMLSSRRKR